MASTLTCGDNSPADLLKRYSVPYIEGAYHLYIGTVRSTQGWILHLSVLPSQLTTLLDVILPELLLCRAAFKVIRNKTVHYQLNAGHFGSTRVGKAITVYAEEGPAAATLAARLVALTGSFDGSGSAQGSTAQTGAALTGSFGRPGSFRGPRVETDLELSPIVYARYGSFRPFRQADAQGYPANYVYDGKGRLVRDLPVVPVRIPEGISPPFPQWTKVRPRIQSYRPVGGRYIPLRLMADSYWGQTWSAIRLKGFSKHTFSGHHCLLLLGKQHILSDEAGLDIHDRFVYRQQLTAALQPHIPVPEIYDCFAENGDTYLAMENPGGRSLDNVCQALLENTAWHTLPLRRKNRILGYLDQVSKILGKLDQLGYILPNTGTDHWGVTGQDKVYLDHLDTIYSPAGGVKAPYPGEVQSDSETLLAFPGARTLAGTFSQLCIRAVTGLHPAWIKQQDPERRRACLETLLQDAVLVDALEEGDPERLSRVFSAAGSATASGTGSGTKPAKPLPDLQDYLARALTTLSQPALAANRKWFSLPPSFEGLPEGVPPAQGAHQGGWPHLGYYNGLYQGTSGILCFLREAAKCGFTVHTMEPLVHRGLIYLSTQSLNTINHNAPGLFTGSAGFAIGLCSALHISPIYKESNNYEAIRFCLERKATAGDILTGAAGQGIAVLHCAPFLQGTFVRTKLLENAFLLLETQQKDGSWFREGTRHGTHGNGGRGLERSYGCRIRDRERSYGFGRGIAGICYFLLEYGNRYHDAAAVQAAVRGLNYLVRVSVKSHLGGGYQWTTGSGERKKEGVGWFDGTPGIALVFLKAYEHLGTPGYRRIAEETLRTIPARYTSPNLSLYNGLSGLGEIYLEAARILKDQEWQSRSTWIARLLTEMAISDKTGSCYWHVLPPGRPTADLMVGNTGVMHFLLRYLHPEKVGLAVMGNQFS